MPHNHFFVFVVAHFNPSSKQTNGHATGAAKGRCIQPLPLLLLLYPPNILCYLLAVVVDVAVVVVKT